MVGRGRAHQALPLESRGALDILLTPRPQLSKDRNRYVYYPGLRRGPGIRVAQHPQPLVHDRGRAGGRPGRRERRALRSGARFGGHALYLKDGTLKYVYNWVGEFEQMIESSEPIPTGHVVVSATFEKEGDAMPTEGTLTLHIRDQAVGSARIKTQPGKFSLTGEGLNVGKDGGEPVTDDYPGTSPWALTGATAKRAIVDVSGEPFVDLAKEAVAIFARE